MKKATASCLAQIKNKFLCVIEKIKSNHLFFKFHYFLFSPLLYHQAKKDLINKTI
jgi:hypothetical protein